MKIKALLFALAAPAAFATQVVTNSGTAVDPSLASAQAPQATTETIANAEQMIEAPEDKAIGLTFDINLGTQGAGISIGYEFNKYFKMRMRGAYLAADYDDEWDHDVEGKFEFDGNNAGILFDYHPFGGVFHLTAGLNFSKMELTAKGRLQHNYAGKSYELGGYTFYAEGNEASVDAKYDWNDLQPYLGIGWSTDGDGDSSLYFTMDIGVNFIGKGKFSISGMNGVMIKDPNGNLIDATNQILEDAVLEEGKDFFDIADKIIVYPVIQLGMGYRF